MHNLRSHGIREGKPQDETRYYVSRLRTGAKALIKAIRQRWSIENSWHWVRDVPLREDAHRYRETKGVQILATLRSLAINAALPAWGMHIRHSCSRVSFRPTMVSGEDGSTLRI